MSKITRVNDKGQSDFMMLLSLALIVFLIFGGFGSLFWFQNWQSHKLKLERYEVCLKGPDNERCPWILN